MTFLLIMVGFMEKEKKIANMGKNLGSYTTAKESHTAAEAHAKVKGSHAAAWPRRRIWTVSGSPQRSSTS